MEKFGLLVILLVFLILIKPAIAAGKVFLLISQQFPQIPIKPLHAITPAPHRETVELGKDKNKIVADVFVPKDSGKYPGVIVAMGMRTNERDKPILLGFSESLARLGFVVIWPRLEALDKDEVKFERPETFIKAFRYLEEREEVNKQRISFTGFSVGSSLAMVAGEDKLLGDKLHSLVFFGGYYNILDYLTSLATGTIVIEGKKVKWAPSEDGINHAKEVLKEENLTLEKFSQGSLTKEEIKRLLPYSPDQGLDNFRARTFILHDKDDPYVPYVESLKLQRALEGKVPITAHLSNLFEHAQVSGEKFSPKLILEFLGLFGFLYQVFLYL